MPKWTQLWLQYRRTENPEFAALCRTAVLCGFHRESAVVRSAVEELGRGLSGCLGISPEIRFEMAPPGTSFDTETSGGRELPGGIASPSGLLLCRDGALGAEEYAVELTGGSLQLPADAARSVRGAPARGAGEDAPPLRFCGAALTLRAGGGPGLLYGVSHLLRCIGTGLRPAQAVCRTAPRLPLRMLNHWDDLTGSIERGYSGRSFFFRDGEILLDGRTVDYARLISSVGVNAVVINNVNVRGDAAQLITDRYLDRLAELAEIFAAYAVRLFLSVSFAAPMELGGLPDCDPLHGPVREWWERLARHVYEKIPSLGGFLVKADSEGRPGPFAYGRTQADGANLLAGAVRPFGGVIIWRCFVYNCRQDWRDKSTDRAKAGYDAFFPTDGCYLDNVILQIKNGSMDFQIREPVSPLFGALERTNQLLEVQLAQEYTGQQIDVCYLVPLIKEVLDFDTCPGEPDRRVRDLVSRGPQVPAGAQDGGQSADEISGIAAASGPDSGQPAVGFSGIAAVANTGSDANWTGSDLAAANLYGFGRLAFDPSLTAEAIAAEWTKLTFGPDEEVVRTVCEILLASRETYEMYTTPLGLGWMVTPGSHYGCSVTGYEYSPWGTYHRADHSAVGIDRSSRGTGFALQYRGENARLYDDPDTCPEELLLFFHRVPYTRRLRDGRTLIQFIYDAHFEGYERVCRMEAAFRALKGRVDDAVYKRVLERFAMQRANAREWRDQVNSFFYRLSGIEDEAGRTLY